MNDALRAHEPAHEGSPGDSAVPVFNEVFLNSVRKRGRMHEMGLMAAFKLRTGRLFADVDKLPMMLPRASCRCSAARRRKERQAEREELFAARGQGGPRQGRQA